MSAPANPHPDRRTVIASSLAGTAALAASRALAQDAPVGGTTPVIELPALPYPLQALEPVISQRTLEFHYGKHHQGYVTTLNDLIKDSDLAGKSLEDIIVAAQADASRAKIFNNAAQIWNHTFYWNSLKPGGSRPEGALLKKIEASFKNLDDCKAALLDAALTQFGSGWAWLVLEGEALKIVKTSNADLPMVHGQKALLTIDVWEHAYYLDHQNQRKAYAQAVIDKLLNWEFAARNAS